ncbi:TOMM precursor leader peptide-binding protein [Nonomuraea sp. NPDC050202]|uniref:TOMM precursor leader peptide-binding protein n=1 Tax=Nonomuraea sp. NPDC050202 TaxID=3155035 RepID=UPI0033D14972
MTNPRPRLRDDCWYVPVEDGLYLRTHTHSLRLQGGGLHSLLERLAPLLDGTRSVAELVAGLPPRPAQVVTQLTQELLRHGLARDAATELPHELEPWEVRRYAKEIAFAEGMGGSGAHRFERFRLGKVLLVGAGGTMTALVRSILRIGVRHPAVWTTSEVPTETDLYQTILAERREDDPAQQLTMVSEPDPGSDLHRFEAEFAGYDAILHCSDRPMLGRAAIIARAARSAGIPSLHALPIAGAAWVGPSGPDTAGGCMECAVRRARGAVSRDHAEWAALDLSDRPDAAEPYLSGPLIGMVAATLAMGYFRLVVDTEETAARITVIDLATATAQEHRLYPHPSCRACAPPELPPVADRISHLSVRPAVTAEVLFRRAADLLDRRFGPLIEVGEADRTQVPLAAVAATVADPAALASGPLVAIAVAPDRARARQRALLGGLELAARCEPPACDEPMEVAGGFTWNEAVGRALLRCHGRRPLGDWLPLDAGTAVPMERPEEKGWRRIEPDEPDTATRNLLNSAELLGTPLEVWLRAGPIAEIAVRAVNGEHLVRGCALTVSAALEAGVEGAIAAIVGHPISEVAIPQDLGDDEWDRRLEPLLRRLAEGGRQVLVTPVDRCQEINDVLPFLAAVAVVPGPRRAR